jgi:D-inositol-3-phosphate glycosyltransferase
MAPWTWPRLARAVRRSGADALVLPYWTSAWAAVDLFLANFAALPVVGVVHNAADHDAGAGAHAASRVVLGRCRAFLCHASTVGRGLAGAFPSSPVAVHPLPAEGSVPVGRAAARTRLGLEPEAVAVLCFGLIRPYKGVDVLLDAFACTPPDPPLTLLLAGEPWGRAAGELRRRLARPDLAGRVVAHLGWLAETEVPVWFAAADAVVLPYRSATGSAVAAQALGFGLPVVGSKVGGIADVIEDEANGLLVAPSDPAALSAALVRIGDAALRTRLASGARAAAARWTWDGYASTLEDLVARVVAQREPAKKSPARA